MSDIINEIADVIPKTKDQVKDAVSNAVSDAKELAQEVHTQKEDLQNDSNGLEKSIVDKNGYDQVRPVVSGYEGVPESTQEQTHDAKEVSDECIPDF